MVAETHSHHDEVDFTDVVTYVLEHLGGVDGDPNQVTLADCGFEMALDIVDLSHMLGEEFGERTLSSGDLDDVDGDTSVSDFVASMYPHLVPADGGIS